MLRIFRYEVSSLVYTIEKSETEHLLDWRQCGGGGGGQSGQPLAVPTHAHLVVGRTEGGGYVGLSGVVVNAGHAPHHVTPDVGAVAGEEASHQTKVLCALKQ